MDADGKRAFVEGSTDAFLRAMAIDEGMDCEFERMHIEVKDPFEGETSSAAMSDKEQILDEASYLMSSPENAQRLREAIEDLGAGRGVAHSIIEE